MKKITEYLAPLERLKEEVTRLSDFIETLEDEEGKGFPHGMKDYEYKTIMERVFQSLYLLLKMDLSLHGTLLRYYAQQIVRDYGGQFHITEDEQIKMLSAMRDNLKNIMWNTSDEMKLLRLNKAMKDINLILDSPSFGDSDAYY